MLIRSLTDVDLYDVAQVHIEAFPDSVLTMFGPDVIRKYYQWQLGPQNKCFAIGYYEEKELLGYSFAGVFHDSEIGFFRQNWKELLWHILSHSSLLKSRNLRKRAVYLIRVIVERFSHKKRQGSNGPHIDKFGILSTAVNPRYQGMGIGGILTKQVEVLARQMNFKSIRLSVHIDNKKSITLHEKLGYQKVISESGFWSGIMEKTLF